MRAPSHAPQASQNPPQNQPAGARNRIAGSCKRRSDGLARREHGRLIPTAEQRRQLADRFGVTPDGAPTGCQPSRCRDDTQPRCIRCVCRELIRARLGDANGSRASFVGALYRDTEVAAILSARNQMKRCSRLAVTPRCPDGPTSHGEAVRCPSPPSATTR